MTNLSPLIYVSKMKDTLSAIDKNSPTSDGIFFSITKLASFARFLRPICYTFFFHCFVFKGEGIKTTPLSSNLNRKVLHVVGTILFRLSRLLRKKRQVADI